MPPHASRVRAQGWASARPPGFRVEVAELQPHELSGGEAGIEEGEDDGAVWSALDAYPRGIFRRAAAPFYAAETIYSSYLTSMTLLWT